MRERDVPLCQLDTICVGRAGERTGETELLERGLGNTLDAWRVGRIPAGVGVIGKAANSD
jgi:hypothetical protein